MLILSSTYTYTNRFGKKNVCQYISDILFSKKFEFAVCFIVFVNIFNKWNNGVFSLNILKACSLSIKFCDARNDMLFDCCDGRLCNKLKKDDAKIVIT